MDGDVSLDLGSPSGGSAMDISFVPSTTGRTSGSDEEVPDVRGYTATLAQRKLAHRGFAVNVTSVTGAKGIVSEQAPQAGVRSPAGTVVRLIVR
jgi:beta-lactam-binding protein with PASTA domain